MIGSCIYDPECTHLIPNEKGTGIRLLAYQPPILTHVMK